MIQLSIELYKKMYLIRRAEEEIQINYSDDDMKTPMHMSMGGEAIATGVCQALNPSDQVLGTYRTHALFLAKTGDTDRFFAEMYGKRSGTAQGKAGSMHLSAVDQGLLYCSAIVASSIPVALGAAFANSYLENGKNVAVFFGDGAIDEGVFWESVNFASLRGLPVLFICEDNGFAVHTARRHRHGFDSINEVVSQFKCDVFERDTTDPEEIYRTTKDALDLMKRNSQPCFLRFHYYRYLEHVGVNEDFNAGYRPKAEYLKWRKRDPMLLQRARLLDEGVDEWRIGNIEGEVDERIAESIQRAKKAPFANVSELYNGVFRCE